MTNRLTSTEFRKAYIWLVEPTEVTALGRVIGLWLPAEVSVPARPPKLPAPGDAR